MQMTDSTQRFTDRVGDYVRFRPGYPAGLAPDLLRLTGCDATAAIADFGSGTGIFTELLLRQGVSVYAVEPNQPMRAAAEQRLGDNPRFQSIGARAEDSGLQSASLDLVTAAQAFHWFNNDAARGEFRRILKPRGQIALIWNRRDTSQPFQHAYEQLLREFAPEYGKVNHMDLGPEQIARYFADGKMQRLHYDNSQRLDFASLLGRLKSSSYCPKKNSPHYIPLVNELLALFDHCAKDGHIDFDYATQVFLGPVNR
jgi:SAM-dependent methyltransferase